MLEEVEASYIPVCCADDVQEGESFDAMAKAKSLTWFGFGLFPRFGDPVPFNRETIGK